MVWLADYAIQPRNQSDKLVTSFGILQNITERKQIEEAIKVSEEKYRTLTNNVNVGVYRNSLGPKGRFIEVNPAIVKMFGYRSREEFLSVNVSNLYQTLTDLQDFVKKLLDAGSLKDKMQLRRKDGTAFIGSISAVVVKDENGNAIYSDGIIEDITERKRAEEKLVFQASLLGQVHNGVIALDLDNKIIYWNKYAQELYQWKSEEELGKDIVELLSPEEMKSTVMDNIRTIHREGHWEGEFKRKDGSTIPTLTNFQKEPIHFLPH